MWKILSLYSVISDFQILFSGLDDRGLEAQQMSGGLYGHRSNSSASSSPPATSGSGQTGLVVPQPINAAKGGQGHAQGATGNGGHIHTHPSNGSSGRKYQCKMCPQVGKVGRSFIFCKQTTIDLFLNTKSFKRYVSRLQKKILVPF